MEEKELTLEETFILLEDTARKLEQEDITLEESFRLYHLGMELLKTCNQKIDTVEKMVLKIDDHGEIDEL